MTECPACGTELEDGWCPEDECPVDKPFEHVDRTHPQIDRFVTPPSGWHRNPDCDLHGKHVVDMVTRDADRGEPAIVDVAVDDLDTDRFTVALNAGLRGNKGPEDYDHITVSRGHVQYAVYLLALRADRCDGVMPSQIDRVPAEDAGEVNDD